MHFDHFRMFCRGVYKRQTLCREEGLGWPRSFDVPGARHSALVWSVYFSCRQLYFERGPRDRQSSLNVSYDTIPRADSDLKKIEVGTVIYM